MTVTCTPGRAHHVRVCSMSREHDRRSQTPGHVQPQPRDQSSTRSTIRHGMSATHGTDPQSPSSLSHPCLHHVTLIPSLSLSHQRLPSPSPPTPLSPSAISTPFSPRKGKGCRPFHPLPASSSYFQLFRKFQPITTPTPRGPKTGLRGFWNTTITTHTSSFPAFPAYYIHYPKRPPRAFSAETCRSALFIARPDLLEPLSHRLLNELRERGIT